MGEKLRSAEVEIRAVQEGDRAAFDSFTCGNSELDAFLKEDTLDRQGDGLLRTYVAIHRTGGDLVGYVSMLADVIRLQPDEVDAYPVVYPIPALKVARLGIASAFQGRGAGSILMRYAVGRLVVVSDLVGCRLLVVDAKIETGAPAFYEKLGFVRNMHKDYVKRKHAVSMRLDPLGSSRPPLLSDS